MLKLVRFGALSLISCHLLASQTIEWKRIRVFTDKSTIMDSVDIIDATWDKLQFRYKYPCANDPTVNSLILIASTGEKGAKPLASKRVENLAASGTYELVLPSNTASVIVFVGGRRCTSNVELEVFAPHPIEQGNNAFDFRQLNWGATKDQVIAIEGSPIKTDPDTLKYIANVNGNRAAMTFQFVGGELAQAQYALLETYSEPTQYLIIGADWARALTDKYGAAKTEIQWVNELYRRDEKRYAFAISAGHLVVGNSWETGRTKISQSLTGQNYEVTLKLTYTSKAHEAALRTQQKAAERRIF